MNGLVFPGGQALPAANPTVAPQPDFTQAARYQAPTAIVPSMPARQPSVDPARAVEKQSSEPSTSLIRSIQGVPVVQCVLTFLQVFTLIILSETLLRLSIWDVGWI